MTPTRWLAPVAFLPVLAGLPDGVLAASRPAEGTARATAADTIIRPPAPPRAAPDATDRPRAELRRVAALQDLCLMETGRYCDQAALEERQQYAGPARVYVPTPSGWSAMIVLPHVPKPLRCGIFVGGASAPHPAVTVEREPACW